jgi:hypothetical protein
VARLHRLIPSAVLAAALAAGMVTAAGAQSAGWFKAGDAPSTTTGTWSFIQTLPETNLIEQGLLYVRVTNGPCDGSPESFVVFEGQLKPSLDSSDNSYSAGLVPVGTNAQSTVGSQPNPPQAVVIPAPTGSVVRIDLVNVRPEITFSACFASAP